MSYTIYVTWHKFYLDYILLPVLGVRTDSRLEDTVDGERLGVRVVSHLVVTIET